MLQTHEALKAQNTCRLTFGGKISEYVCKLGIIDTTGSASGTLDFLDVDAQHDV